MPTLCCGKKAAASAVRPEWIGGATAVREEYNMWVMPMSNFIELEKLQPHQQLKEAGKIVQFDRSMATTFFLSHQCVALCCHVIIIRTRSVNRQSPIVCRVTAVENGALLNLE